MISAGAPWGCRVTELCQSLVLQHITGDSPVQCLSQGCWWGWISRKIPAWKGLSSTATAAQSSDGVPIPGGVGKECGCGTWGRELGRRGGAGWMGGPDGLRGLFHNDSMILCQTGSAQSPWWPCPDLSGKVVPAQSSSWDSQDLLVLVAREETPGQGSRPGRTPNSRGG